MKLADRNIGLAVTGSHCTIKRVIPVIEKLIQSGARVVPIISESVLSTDTRFGSAENWLTKIQDICNHKIIDSIVTAEPIGPEKLLDLLIIAPCTGNTMAKIAGGIIDQTVVMAAKAQLRNSRPLLIAIATNDGLGLNARNIGILFNTENIFFVPFGQDNPVDKPRSLVARMELIPDAAEMALSKTQIQPVLIEYRGI